MSIPYFEFYHSWQSHGTYGFISCASWLICLACFSSCFSFFLNISSSSWSALFLSTFFPFARTATSRPDLLPCCNRMTAVLCYYCHWTGFLMSLPWDAMPEGSHQLAFFAIVISFDTHWCPSSTALSAHCALLPFEQIFHFKKSVATALFRGNKKPVT